MGVSLFVQVACKRRKHPNPLWSVGIELSLFRVNKNKTAYERRPLYRPKRCEPKALRSSLKSRLETFRVTERIDLLKNTKLPEDQLLILTSESTTSVVMSLLKKKYWCFQLNLHQLSHSKVACEKRRSFKTHLLAATKLQLFHKIRYSDKPRLNSSTTISSRNLTSCRLFSRILSRFPDFDWPYLN